MESLSAYLKRQARLHFVYRALVWGHVLLLVAALSIFAAKAIFFLGEYFWSYSWNQFSFLDTGIWFLVFILGAAYFFSRWRSPLQSAAREVEAQAVYFNFHPEARSELVTAAHFLEEEKESDFHKAHRDRWERKTSQLPALLLPTRRIFLSLLICWLGVGAIKMSEQVLVHRYPPQALSWLPTEFEAKLPLEGRSWTLEQGSLSGVAGTQVRFLPPDLGIFQPYLFVSTPENRWLRIACSPWCETTIKTAARYSVGSLWERSAEYPIYILEDEEPRARLFVKEGSDLVPNPRLNIISARPVELQLLASDDFGLLKIELIHRFNSEESVLYESQKPGRSFRFDYLLRMEDWEGGQHEVFIRATDQLHTIDSSAVSISYANEEFLREQRNKNFRAYLDEWIHVLADLIETRADQALAPGLESRLREMKEPETYDHELFDIWVVEMDRMRESLQREIVLLQNFDRLSHYVPNLEQQILYALSLLFQEKAGDVQAAKQEVQETQEDISQLLERIRSGEEKLDSDLLKDAFSRLTKQLENLQERLKNLPQGPQDMQVNREAIEEQVAQSEDLEKRISEIQKLIELGQDEAALKELESLMNQLSILNREIDSSLRQWEQNLAQGAVQSSEKFEKDLEALKKRQEELLRRTEDWKQRGEKLNEDFLTASPAPKEVDKLRETLEKWQNEGESLADQQDKLSEEYRQSAKNFSESLEGSDWESLFRGQDQKELETRVQEQMKTSVQALDGMQSFEAVESQQLTVELMRQSSEAQQKIREQIKQQAQQLSQRREIKENFEIVESEGRGERERRQQIMNSLRQEVDEEFQPSHDRYFEELLQR